MAHPLNFARVDDRIFRGGQPKGIEWDSLVYEGIRSVLKLNELTTGDDASACSSRGLILIEFTITDEVAQSQIDEVSVFDRIDDILDSGGPWYAHCTEGKDRVGIVVARYRVRRQGWSKEKAWNEWVAMGSHGYKGLVKAWQDWQPGK